jgi:hypothetical protein
MDSEKENVVKVNICLLPKADAQLEMCCEAAALIAGHHVHEAERALVAHAATHRTIVADHSERIFRLITMFTYCFLRFGHD